LKSASIFCPIAKAWPDAAGAGAGSGAVAGASAAPPAARMRDSWTFVSMAPSSYSTM